MTPRRGRSAARATSTSPSSTCRSTRASAARRGPPIVHKRASTPTKRTVSSLCAAARVSLIEAPMNGIRRGSRSRRRARDLRRPQTAPQPILGGRPRLDVARRRGALAQQPRARQKPGRQRTAGVDAPGTTPPHFCKVDQAALLVRGVGRRLHRHDGWSPTLPRCAVDGTSDSADDGIANERTVTEGLARQRPRWRPLSWPSARPPSSPANASSVAQALVPYEGAQMKAIAS